MLRRSTRCALVAIGALAIACGGSSGGGGSRATATVVAPTPPSIETLSAPATVTNDGLQIIDIKLGAGDEARAGDIVYINHNEWLTDGSLQDTTTVNSIPVPNRRILRQGQQIQGLLEGIPGMKAGGKRRLVIPPNLGYGSAGSGNAVPPGATLIFDIELVRVEHP